MDEVFQVKRAIDAWLEQATVRTGAGEVSFSFESRHLDELGVQWKLGGPGVTTVVEMVVAASIDLPADFRVALAIPLVDTDDPRLNRPDLNRLPLADMEPPSIYLFASRYFSLLGDVSERVILPYLTNPWKLDPGVLHVEHVSRRDPESVENGWKFGNTLWVYVVG